MAVDDVYRGTFVWSDTDTGELLTSAFSMRQVDSVWNSTFVLDAMEDWWDTTIGGVAGQLARHPPEVVLTALELQRIEPLEPVVTVRPVSIAGTQLGDEAPPQASQLLSIRTAEVGRRRRGRMYLPRTTENGIGTDGLLTAALALNNAEKFVEMAQALAAGLNPAEVGVFSAVQQGVDGDGFRAATVIYGDRRLRSQRRRQDESTLYEDVAV